MEVYVDDLQKEVRIWLSNADQKNEQTMTKMKSMCADYHKNKYFVCVFRSGRGNLYDNTKELVKKNRNTLSR